MNIKILKKLQGRKIVKVSVDGQIRNGISGDTAIWIPLSKQRGVKIVDVCYKENVEFLRDKSPRFIPKITNLEESNGSLFITCENIPKKTPSLDLGECAKFFIDNRLLPEKGWSKDINVHGDKLIDFHNTKLEDKHYAMPVDSINKIQRVHEESLNKFKEMGTNGNGVPKRWKGKIYQGMTFADGISEYTMQGYSSDTKYFDSYLKMQFSSIDFCKDKTVLDIGCNEGFFIHQARLAGANRAVGIELCEEDIALAKNIQDNLICDAPLGEFLNIDANEYVKNCDKFDIIYLFSVVHQLCDSFEGHESFFKIISKKVNDLIIFETPFNHPRMNTQLVDLEAMLGKYFSQVRPLYAYDAYSTGWRQIYGLYK